MTPRRTPRRIQRKRTRGWKLPANTVIVDRTSRFGNPFTIKGAIDNDFASNEADARKLAVEAFESVLAHGRNSSWWFEGGGARFERIRADLPLLVGKDVACTCPEDGLPCHGDVLIRLAAALPAPSGRTTP